jgi:hypothetical protein
MHVHKLTITDFRGAKLLPLDHFDEARRFIAEMKSEIGEDPELLKAEILIRRKEGNNEL